MQATKTLSLVKGDQHFCFRYEIGQEAKVSEKMLKAVDEFIQKDPNLDQARANQDEAVKNLEMQPPRTLRRRENGML